MKTRHRIRKALLILLPLAALLIYIFHKEDKTLEVEAVCVEKISLEEAIPASGKIHPVMEVKISPDVSGEIVELNVQEGDHVVRGDTIIQIKQDLYKSRVEQVEASLASLKAQHCRNQAELAKATLEFKRSSELLAEGAIATAEYESAEATYKMAQQGVLSSEFTIQSGEAELREALESLAKTTICAPMSGIVSRLCVETGERVVGTSQMAGTEMLRIADFNKMELVVDIGENDIVRISPGDSVSIDIDAYPHKTFKGFVTKIANSAKNIDATFEKLTNFEVRIEIVADGAKLLPGMSAAATIITDKRENCMTIPAGCVFAEGKKEFVWVVGKDFSVEKRSIVTGIQDLSSIEVVDGLNGEESVVSAPLSAISKELTSGQKVKVKENGNNSVIGNKH